MSKNIFKNKKGFVLLFSMLLSSIMLMIALGVANISYKEIKFSTSAKDTNDAFFAADAGAECVLFNDKSNSGVFVQSGTPNPLRCLGNVITLNGSSPSWNFVIANLGGVSGGCAKVTVTKNFATVPASMVINSKGYNVGDASCISSNPNRVERELQVTF